MTGVSERSQQSCNLKDDGYIVGNEFASQSLPSGERQEPLINPREHR
ncbi:hypothetical protein GQ668_07915 [Xenorhabdus nematophila]|nr:hypothetical protein [Xenorhabdus nematophila]